MTHNKPSLQLIIKMIKQQAAMGNIYTSFMDIEKLIEKEIDKSEKKEDHE